MARGPIAARRAPRWGRWSRAAARRWGRCGSCSACCVPGKAGGHGRLPGLGDLPGLAGSMGRQGVMVTVRAGELGAVPAAVSLAAYRVVQEALTNVVKHAGGGSRVTVEVGASGGAVLVTVEDYAGP